MRLFVGLVVLLSSGCGCEGVRVRQVQDFAEDCSVPTDRGAPSHTQGTLDVAFQGEYVLTPLLEADGATDITGAVVRLYETSSPSLPPEETEPVLEFFSYGSLSLGAGEVGTMTITVVPAEYAVRRYRDLCGLDPGGAADPFDPATDLVLAGVTLRDSTDDVSEELFYPVSLCCGCLVACPPEADDTAEPELDCCSNSPVEDEACVPGQDEQMDCRLCRTDSDPLLSSLCACGFQGTCGG